MLHNAKFYFFKCQDIQDTISVSWLYHSYVQSACKIFKAAEEGRLDRDEERAYVLYMKYLTVYDLLKKRPDFKLQQVGGTWSVAIRRALVWCWEEVGDPNAF
jgi:hypothetical protein